MASVNPIQIQKYLKDVDYPVSKADLIRRAEEHGADKNIRETLERLTEKEFKTPTEVSQAISKVH
jgi:hypothetical protein